MRIGIIGGTFDPIHLGHLIVAEEARVQLELAQVIFIPTGRPWLKAGQPLTEGTHRYNMLQLAVSSNPYFRAVRNEIDRPGPTYTVETLMELCAGLVPATELYFILGRDALAQFHLWKDPDMLLELCKLVVVSRPGYPDGDLLSLTSRYPQAIDQVIVLPVPLIQLSGTEIRRRAANGISFRYHVPEAVERYIMEHRLYRDALGGSEPPHSHLFSKEGIEGRTLSTEVAPLDDTVQRLLELALARGALRYGDFTLSSGRKSGYYFDSRRLSLDPEGAHLIGKAVLPILRRAGVEAVGGPTLGADPIVTAIALTSYLEGRVTPGEVASPISAFIVRKEAKAHGTEQSVEGPLVPGSRVAIIDDVCTTGGSLFHAIAAAEAAGCTVVKVLALLDRREGGSEEMRRRGYDFVALMTATPQGRIEVLPEVVSG